MRASEIFDKMTGISRILNPVVAYTISGGFAIIIGIKAGRLAEEIAANPAQIKGIYFFMGIIMGIIMSIVAPLIKRCLDSLDNLTARWIKSLEKRAEIKQQ